MIAHEAIGIEPPVLLADFLRQEIEEGQSIDIVEEDILAPVTPGSEVIYGAREFEAERAGHGQRLDKKE